MTLQENIERIKEMIGIIVESYLNGIKDNDIVAATLIGEAGGEDEKGMMAVCNTIYNRATKKGTSMAGESLRPYQFSMWNNIISNVTTKKDYNVNLIIKLINKKKLHPKWNQALNIVENPKNDITKGATHYYAFKGANRIKPPSFTNNWKQTTVIGNHKFGIV